MCWYNLGVTYLINHFLQMRTDLSRDFANLDVVDWPHGHNGIDRRDFNIPVIFLLHNDAAWQHRSDLVFRLKRSIRP